MSKNNLLNSQQYGFVSGRSTVLQLIKVMDRWTEILDKGGCIDVVYCDFLKAFDKVPHKRLVQKLNYYGIAPVLVNWIKEFLSDRKQKVMVNGECSTWYEVTSGIPQGSVLGPTLFVMYINSLPDVISQSSSYLFADDTKLANGIFENSDCEALQSDLNNMVEWTEKSLLKFHPDKCVHMTIGKSKLEERTYTLGHNGPVIRKVKEEKDIGIIFDAELKFSSHISEKVNKANSIMGLVRRTFTHLDKGNFALLFKSLVRPHLEFANQVWSPYLQKHIQEIENVQRRATKLIPGMKDLTYEERLKTLNLPTLKYRRFRGDMIEMYKLLNSKYNTTISDFIEINPRTSRGHSYKLSKKHSRLDVRKNSFVPRSVNLWNSLPENVVEAPNVKTFEKRIDKLWRIYKYTPEIQSHNLIINTRSDRRGLSGLTSEEDL